MLTDANPTRWLTSTVAKCSLFSRCICCIAERLTCRSMFDVCIFIGWIGKIMGWWNRSSKFSYSSLFRYNEQLWNVTRCIPDRTLLLTPQVLLMVTSWWTVITNSVPEVNCLISIGGWISDNWQCPLRSRNSGASQGTLLISSSCLLSQIVTRLFSIQADLIAKMRSALIRTALWWNLAVLFISGRGSIITFS